MRRRTLLAGALVGLAGCGRDLAEKETKVFEEKLFRYGDDPAQVASLHWPAGDSRGVVVVIHGGFWKAQYDASIGVPLAQDLARRGWTAWNLEYRRVGNGGGWPETFDDIAAGIDHLATLDGLDLSTVVTLGHSAGGHLATWAAARGRFDRWRPERVPVTGVVSQAGVVDLTAAARDDLGGGAVQAFLGRLPGKEWEQVDPMRQLPLDVPFWGVHGTGDTVVPLSQSAEYVDAATAAGAQAELVEIDGDHFTVIDPESEAWARTVGILEAL